MREIFEPVIRRPRTSIHSGHQDYDILIHLKGMIAFDPSSYMQALKELGDNGIPLLAVERTAWQQLWVQWVNIEDLSWHFLEHEDRLMRTVGLLEQRERRILECAAKVCPLFVDFPDNITAQMIGPDKFRRFCLPFYRELAGRLAESGGVACCHMDGNLKPLWELIGESGLRALDSLSPPPDNDTSVGEACRLWPAMRILINFPSSVHLMDPERIRMHTREILKQGGDTGRLSIDISENVPPTAWRTSLPVIAEEIAAHGTPAVWR